MKEFLKSKKALSPVVAAIILIAVTVAVSIAVAAWMGSLTIGFMETTELTITELDFVVGDSSNGRIIAYVTNSGTSSFTVDRIRVNGNLPPIWSADISETIAPGDSEIFTITHVVEIGNKYAVTLYKIDGSMVGAYTDTA